MASVIDFPKAYRPSVDAAICDLMNAEFEFEAIRNMPVDEHGDCVPLHRLERLRSARERMHLAQDNARHARYAELGRKMDAIWQ